MMYNVEGYVATARVLIYCIIKLTGVIDGIRHSKDYFLITTLYISFFFPCENNVIIRLAVDVALCF